MDGYAVVADDTLGANEHSPVVLRVGDSVRLGVASRVHTGSKIPDQADSVVMVEDVERLGDVVEVRAQVHPFENVGLKGRTLAAVMSLLKPAINCDLRTSVCSPPSRFATLPSTGDQMSQSYRPERSSLKKSLQKGKWSKQMVLLPRS